MTGKRDFQLNEQEEQELKSAFTECADGPMRTRLQAVRLYGSGYAVEEISEIAGCSRRTLLRWCQRYRDDLSNSPRMRSAPHKRFAPAIFLIRSMVSWGIRDFGFPFRDLRRQYKWNRS